MHIGYVNGASAHLFIVIHFYDRFAYALPAGIFTVFVSVWHDLTSFGAGAWAGRSLLFIQMLCRIKDPACLNGILHYHADIVFTYIYIEPIINLRLTRLTKKIKVKDFFLGA
jgi:hypothetical protein